MSTIEYPNRSQRKSQLARNTIALVSSLLSKRVKDSGRLARFTPRGLSRGSERVSNGNDACAYGMAVRRVHVHTRSLSQAVQSQPSDLD